MSSILTNSSAMVALQTLKGINSSLSKTQDEISTGKSVATAKDNAAVWAISKVMEADVKGFKGISDSLALGESTVSVARQASETVTDLLTEIKGKIVAAQEDNVDRSKIQTDIAALTKQIESVVGAAQFNGLNLVDGKIATLNSNGVNGADVLASLDRDATGTVVTSSIGVNAQNLSTTAGLALTTAAANVGTDPGVANVIDKNDGGTADSISFDTFAFLDAAGGATGGAALSRTAAGVDNAIDTGLVEGDRVSLRIGSVEGRYTIKEGDTAEAIVAGMKNSLVANGLSDTSFTMDIATATGTLTVTNNTNQDISFSFGAARGSGGLAGLSTMDVSTNLGADDALAKIEGMIQTSISAAAEFGSAQKRISIQSDFVGKLSDSLKAGIGAMVDADMEEASARLQALQVQQQLGIQSLSIANQAPQNILALFR
jgi:flagellin